MSTLDASTSATGNRPSRRKRAIGLLHVLSSVVLLAVTLYLVDARAVAGRLGNLDVSWLALALGLSLPLYLVLAARWWLTARSLDAPVGFGRAVSDYYVSTFFNQTLFGMAGEAVRAVRHGRTLGERGLGRAIRIIAIERLTGTACFAVLTTIAGVTFLWRDLVVAGIAFAEAAAIFGTILVLRYWRIRVLGGAAVAELRADARRVFATPGVGVALFGLSTGLLALMIATFYCAGHAAGYGLDAFAVIRVTPVILAATALPLAFAGWGVREAMTAILYAALGLDPASGAAVSVTFGLIALVASAPGIVCYFAVPRARPVDGYGVGHPDEGELVNVSGS